MGDLMPTASIYDCLKKNLFCKSRELLNKEFKGMRCELNFLQYTISPTLDLANPL